MSDHRRNWRETIERANPKNFFEHEGLHLGQENHIGWCDGGLCPFHPDHSRGSFRVNINTGAFKCFSCGAKGSNILKFLMAKHGLNFKDAVQVLERF